MTTPKVQYSYADGSANTIRPTKAAYPNGRELNLDYGSAGGMDDMLSRIGAIVDDDGVIVLSDYSYLGLGTPVITDYTQPDVMYTLVGTAGGNDPDTGDIYRGLDRFGRVKDAYWRDYGSNTDAARIQYGYDRAGNRTYRSDPVATANSAQFDELYGYDAIQRLKTMDRGTLNAGKTALTTKSFDQCWTLDPTGNWKGFRQDDTGDGAWDLVQARTSNPVNEITNITNSVGSSWVTPAYNAAGNMTTIPQPADPTKSYTAKYDAWNRLVKLTDGANTVAEYQYDARNFRTVQKTYTAGTLSETRHFYYSSNWQVLEERVGTSPDSAAAERQFVWGLRYIDDCVLRDRDTTGSGTLNERLYGLQDANWNMIALADTAGDVQERYAYQAYGTPKFLTSAFAYRTNSSFAWETLYCGYRFELATLIAHVRHRILIVCLGTWERRDPIGYQGGLSLFSYCRCRPLVYLDPNGQLEHLGLLGDTLANMATSLECKLEAERIGEAIQNTFAFNRRLHFDLRWLTLDERVKGLYCYEWAYGFEDAFNTETSKRCFSVETQAANFMSGETEHVHYWIAITSNENPSQTIYVDDGFLDGNLIHANPPIPLGWQPANAGRVPRGACRPATPYDCKQNPRPKKPKPPAPRPQPPLPPTTGRPIPDPPKY